MQEILKSLIDRVRRHTVSVRPETPLPRISIGIVEKTSVPMMSVCQPMVCVVLQGAKEATVGDRLLRYDPTRFFATSVELPATGRIIEATPEKPYVAVSMDIDHVALGDLLAELEISPTSQCTSAFGVAPVTFELLGAFDNLLALLDTEKDIPILAKAREREILYRLLQTALRPMLLQVAREDSQLFQVRRAIEWINDHYGETLRVGELAKMVGMSVPTFHRHFKTAAAMSPLQYQKIMRLQSARRQLTVNANASQAAYSVGYVSTSQFTREYSRLFGVTPAKDAAQMRLRDDKDIAII